MELGILIFFGIIAAWMYCTTPRFREVAFGYLMLFAVISTILSFITGIFPNSAYSGIGYVP